MKPSELYLLSLIRSAFGNNAFVLCPQEDDWKEVFALACNQDVAAIAFDGIQACYTLNPKSLSSLDTEKNKDLKYDWFGSCISAEISYGAHIDAITKLATFYASNNIHLLLLKGYGNSLNYPNPEHRTMGDIDVYLFGEGERGDELVKEELGLHPKQNEDKHSTFKFNDILVENHANFVNDVIHPRLKRLESFFKADASNSTPYDFQYKGDSIEVFMPSIITNALFLPLHCATHFVRGESSLRQLCDWACFVNKYGQSINWAFVADAVTEAGYYKFYCCLNGIIEEYLGVRQELLPDWPRYPELQVRILEAFFTRNPSHRLSAFDKFIRFFASGWKYRLVFRESLFITFLRQAQSYFRHNNRFAKSLWKKVY